MALVPFSGELSDLPVGTVAQIKTTKKHADGQPPKVEWRFGRYLGMMGIEENAQITFSFEGIPALTLVPDDQTVAIWVIGEPQISS